MKLGRVWAIARKEFLHVYRDPRSLIMALAIPVLLLVLFGYALTLDVDQVPLAVWDQSGTADSRQFVAQFSGSRYFQLTDPVSSYKELTYMLDSGKALTALTLPRTFADDLNAGRQVKVQFIVDGSDSNTATIALGYAQAITNIYSNGILVDRIERAGGRPPRFPLDVRARVWFNPELESKNFIIPGLIAVILSVIASLLTALTIAREWERGTMEQLISTPVRPVELVVGKLLPYIAIGFADLIIAVVMGQYLFHVPLRGSLVLLFATAGLFLLGALAQGLTISIVAKNQLLAGQIALLSTFLPAFLLSGFAFAISNMPLALQLVTYIVPARYFVTLLKGIYLKGVGLEVMGAEVAILAVFAPLMLLIAIRKFKKKLV